MARNISPMILARNSFDHLLVSEALESSCSTPSTNQGQSIPALKTLQKTVPAFELPVPPTAKLAESKKHTGSVVGLRLQNCSGETGERYFREPPVSPAYQSERIGTNYSVQTIGMSPRLSHNNKESFAKQK